MITAIILFFVIGYAMIAFEHPLKLDKTVPALLMGVGLWTIISIGHLGLIGGEGHLVVPGEAYSEDMLGVLLHHIGKIAEILIFLLGAMTIVELVDLHKGFSVITNQIRTTNKKTMLIIISVVTFFLSAVLDNLTTTIVMISLLRKLIPDQKERLLYVSMVVIAANAGGAWSPIGDVTTTMLWIGKKVTTVKLITSLILPSLICLFIPVLILLFRKELQGSLQRVQSSEAESTSRKLLSSNVMFFVGVGALIFVPIFKSITHLPPYLGMMLGLGVTWLVSEFIHPEEHFDEERKQLYSARHALSRIEMSSILFFLGILLAITALESVVVTGLDGNPVGLLNNLAQQLQAVVPSQDIVIILIGALSAIVDNVPLVAATMGMYTEAIDADLWHFIAFSAGTGGSMLIIGSAAGVAAMGMEKIDFIWYLKNIAWLAAAGFLGGCLVFMAFN